MRPPRSLKLPPSLAPPPQPFQQVTTLLARVPSRNTTETQKSQRKRQTPLTWTVDCRRSTAAAAVAAEAATAAAATAAATAVSAVSAAATSSSSSSSNNNNNNDDDSGSSSCCSNVKARQRNVRPKALQGGGGAVNYFQHNALEFRSYRVFI